MSRKQLAEWPNASQKQSWHVDACGFVGDCSRCRGGGGFCAVLWTRLVPECWQSYTCATRRRRRMAGLTRHEQLWVDEGRLTGHSRKWDRSSRAAPHVCVSGHNKGVPDYTPNRVCRRVWPKSRFARLGFEDFRRMHSRSLCTGVPWPSWRALKNLNERTRLASGVRGNGVLERERVIRDWREDFPGAHRQLAVCSFKAEEPCTVFQ